MARVFYAPASGDIGPSRTGGQFFTAKHIVPIALAILIAVRPTILGGQAPSASQAPALTETGHITAAGKQVPYRIRHLPVNAFPEIPIPIANALTSRGCLIPQTYGAHQPENVIHGSFERVGSLDWAVLCSSGGKVSLLVFLASGSPSAPTMLASAAETSRLQQDGAGEELGFNWGIDTATPKQVHDGEAGARKRSATPDLDCIADSVIDQEPIYRCLQAGKWITLDSQ